MVERENSQNAAPAQRIGIVGGGQLARMAVPTAPPLGLTLTVLARTPDECAALITPNVVLGGHDDPAAVDRLAAVSDVVTFDHEHVPQDILRGLEDRGVAVRPGAAALLHAQDKLVMRRRLTAAGAPCPRWREVGDAAELDAAIADFGAPVIVKTPRGGYDGKGVLVAGTSADAADWLDRGESLLVEERVDYVRELAAQVARRPSGEIAVYPVVETVQEQGTCFEVIAPAQGLDDDAQERISRIAVRIAERLDVTGMLAVELFELADGSVLVNELAMRPHNSGHWSIEGAATSQFEQHLRSVADLPLGPTTPVAPWSVMVNLLGGSRTDLAGGVREALAEDPGVHVHLYGKEVRPHRKIGHVTVVGDDLPELRRRARAAERLIVDGVRPEGRPDRPQPAHKA